MKRIERGDSEMAERDVRWKTRPDAGRAAMAAALAVMVMFVGASCSKSALKASDAKGTAPPGTGVATVAAVTCLKLNDAKAQLKEAGFAVATHDTSGKDRTPIVDSNWVVMSQSPAAEATATSGDTVTLEVAKDDEGPCPAPGDPTTTSAPEPSTEVTEPPTEAPPEPTTAAPAPTTETPPPPPPPSPPPTNPPVTQAPTTAAETVYYASCADARAAGAAPLYRGQPGYREALDRDHDGVACET